MDNETVFKQEYKINSLNLNANKKLGLYGLLGILQDIAREHATTLGFGYQASQERGFFWVLVRKKLKMKSWPSWNDVLTVETWTKPIFGNYAFREYELFVGGQKIGACSTTWMILDTETRKPKKIDHPDDLFHFRKNYELDFMAEKVRLPKTIAKARTIEVQNSDLDLNTHVNNIKYAQWVLDLIPYDFQNQHRLSEYEINFMSETFLGDQIACSSNIANLEQGPKQNVYFTGNRVADNKTVFVARILAVEKTEQP